ncbi:hypothetical protein EMCRGX_G029796 [Ephydatia muelleri]
MYLISKPTGLELLGRCQLLYLDIIHNGGDRPVSAATHADKHDDGMVEAASDEDGGWASYAFVTMSKLVGHNVPGKGAGLAGEYHLHKHELATTGR